LAPHCGHSYLKISKTRDLCAQVVEEVSSGGISSAVSICLRGIFNYTPRIGNSQESGEGAHGEEVRKSAESPPTDHQIFRVPEEGGRRVAVLMVVTKQVPLVFPFPALYKSILIKGLFDDFIWCLKIYGRFVDELKLIEAVGEERMDLPGHYYCLIFPQHYIIPGNHPSFNIF
jgi:hypothetical protein